MADENEIRQALGIDEEADVVAAIKNLQARIDELEMTLKADVQSAAKGELSRLRADLSTAEKRYITLEGEMNKRIITLEEENRREKAERMVDSAIAAGRVMPALKEMALKLALRDPKDFEEFAARLPGVDLRERGVATDSDMAALEPTAIEISIAQQMGNWDASKPEESRLDLMRVKAKEKGIVIPAGYKG